MRLPPARRRFAQHFLEPAWVAKVLAAADLTADDRVLEIGPGCGALTRPLATRVARVIAVEVDRDLVVALETAALPGVQVVLSDFLDVDLDRLLANEPLPWRVVANLPYNVATPILFRLLKASDGGRRCQDATLMLQTEVADRLLAGPGSRAYGSLTLQVGLDADVRCLLTLPPGAFRPAPKVSSTVVRLTFRAPRAEVGDRAVFTRLARGLFLHRRKMLQNALAPVALTLSADPTQLIERAGLDGSRRPQTLTVEDLARLSRAVL